MIWKLGGVAIVVMASLAGKARAGACPEAHLHVYPTGTAPVPTNVQLRMTFDSEMVKLITEGPHYASDDSVIVSASKLEVVLRDDAGASVATVLTRATGSMTPIVIVQPSSILAPNAHYAVVVRANGKDYRVSHLTTEDLRDDVEPSLDKVIKSQLFIYKDYTPRKANDPSGSFANITLSGVSGAAGFEVHELRQPGDTPSGATLRVLMRSDRSVSARGSNGTKVSFGGSGCYADFEFPEVPRGKQPRTLHLWIRAFDLAGNVSPLREILLDLAKPKIFN